MAVARHKVTWGIDEGIGQGNCSAVFFHDETWWGCFRKTSPSPFDYKFARYDTAISDPNLRWQELQKVHDSVNQGGPDCIVDSANDRAYILIQGSSSRCEITSLTYDRPSKTWTLDPLVTEVPIPGISGSGGVEYDDRATMSLAQNGRLFVFDANEC